MWGLLPLFPISALAADVSLKSPSVQMAQQQQAATGIVVDGATGEPIIGATVRLPGNGGGTVTDVDGRFTLPATQWPMTVEVSYVGYRSQQVRIASAGAVTVNLEQEASQIDEVVVTGYGTFKKSAYAGSASNVRAEKMKDVPSVSFQDMLQGNAPGVQFSQASGQPGSATSINIRGMGSFNAGNSPLYVIDGVPMRSGSVSALDTDAGLDIMSTLSSTDIESITVIKDAAAASLYGSRAANGVIIITTRKGREGKPQVSLTADWGQSDFAMQYRPVMSGAQRRSYIYQGLYNGAVLDGATADEATAYATENVEYYAPEPWCGYVDWDDVLFKKGGHANYQATLSGGTSRFKYFTSLGYLKQDGVTRNSGLERITGRVNAEYQATDRLTVGANILFSNINQDVYEEGTSYTSPFYASRNCVVPSDPVYNEDGSWNRSFIRNGDRNPLLAMTYDSRRNYVTRAFNTVYGQYELMKDLRFKTTLSYDYVSTKGKHWVDPRTSNGEDVNGSMSQSVYELKKLVWANQLTYATTVAEKHHLDGLLGYEIDDQNSDYLSGTTSNFASPDKNAISNGVKPEGVGGSPERTRMVSYIARVNYDYDNKYFLGGSYRIDGSSRLHSSHRWGSFWSASAAWRVIEEDFMRPTHDWLTDLKVRASYGVNGTLPSSYYGYMGLSSINGGYNLQPAILLSQIENNSLKWETNYNLNLGLDFALWNRLKVTLEYYTRTTKNLLMDLPISMTTGFGSYLTNIGQVKNSGVELEINSTNFQTPHFSWTTTLNISHNKNKIVKLDGRQTEIIDGTQIHQIGKPYRTFYMVEFAGINPDTGAPQFYTNSQDADGHLVKDITENAAQAHAIALDKHAEPTVIGGLSNSLRYRWVDFSCLFSFQFGGYSYDNWAQKTEHGGNDLEANIPTYYLDNWQKPGDVTSYEVFVEAPYQAMNKITSTRRLHSSDFVRLKTLTLGVTLPEAWTHRIHMGSVRLYASADNLWTWARYDYYDPEAVSGGSAIWGTPPLKTVTFGVNLNF
jgi:TonB-linked SusC/RagA family outer membrane protein